MQMRMNPARNTLALTLVMPIDDGETNQPLDKEAMRASLMQQTM